MADQMRPQFDWHLEFTQSNEIVEFHFNEDDALVFYPEKISEYNQLLDTVRKHNISFIKANNPYWNENGKMIRCRTCHGDFSPIDLVG